MTIITRKSSVQTSRGIKALQEQREDIEKAEPVVIDRFGNTGEQHINADTHSKVVLSNETIKQLINYARTRKGNEWTLLQESFDDIIKGLLAKVQKKRRRTDGD